MSRQSCPVTEDVHNVRIFLSDRILKGPEGVWEDVFDLRLPTYRIAFIRRE